MQKKACKLSQKLALGLAALSFALFGKTEANFNLFVTGNMTWNALLAGPVITGLKKPGGLSDLNNPEFGAADWKNHLWNFVDFSGSAYALWPINDMFSAGLHLSMGLTMTEYKEKAQDMYFGERFYAKLGAAIKFTEWALFSVGVRVPRAFLESRMANPVDGNAYQSGAKSYAWPVQVYGEGNVLIPITDDVKFIIRLGLHGGTVWGGQFEMPEGKYVDGQYADASPVAKSTPQLGGWKPVNFTVGFGLGMGF